MPLVVVTAPTATLVSLAEAKAHLRVDHTDDDTRIQALLWAAQTEFAGPDGWSGRSFSIQQLELQLPQFPGGRFAAHVLCLAGDADILLPCPPLLQDIDHPLSVKYVDRDGVEQTIDPATVYAVIGNGAAGVARIALNYRQFWPLPRWQEDAVRIRYFAGYAGDDVRGEPLKSAIKLHVELAYDGENDTTRRAMNNLLNNGVRIY